METGLNVLRYKDRIYKQFSVNNQNAIDEYNKKTLSTLLPIGCHGDGSGGLLLACFYRGFSMESKCMENWRWIRNEDKNCGDKLVLSKGV